MIKRTVLALGVASAVFAGSAPHHAQAQAGQIIKVTGYLTQISASADSGTVEVMFNFESGLDDEGRSIYSPAMLCPGARTEAGKWVARVLDHPQNRTLMELLADPQKDIIETREGRDGLCYVTKVTQEG